MIVPVFEIIDKNELNKVFNSVKGTIPDEYTNSIKTSFIIKNKYVILNYLEDNRNYDCIDLTFALHYAMRRKAIRPLFFIQSEDMKRVPDEVGEVLRFLMENHVRKSDYANIFIGEDVQQYEVGGVRCPISFIELDEYDFTEGKVFSILYDDAIIPKEDLFEVFSSKYQTTLQHKIAPTTGYVSNVVDVKKKGTKIQLLSEVFDAVEFKPTVENKILFRFGELWPNYIISIEYSKDNLILKQFNGKKEIGLYKFFENKVKMEYYDEYEVSELSKLMVINTPKKLGFSSNKKYPSFKIKKLLGTKTGHILNNVYELSYKGVPLLFVFKHNDKPVICLNYSPTTLYFLTLAHSILYNNDFEIPEHIDYLPKKEKRKVVFGISNLTKIVTKLSEKNTLFVPVWFSAYSGGLDKESFGSIGGSSVNHGIEEGGFIFSVEE